MKKGDTYDIGKKAESLESNEAFIAAISNIKKRYFEKFCNISHDDVEGMKKVNLSMSAIDDLESELKDLIIDGNNAKKQPE